jgi:hypothetical protein
MRIIITLAAMVLAVHCAGLIEVNDENYGVIECITMTYSQALLTDVTKFCGPYSAKNIECYGNFMSVELCLLNNNCQFQAKDTEVR